MEERMLPTGWELVRLDSLTRFKSGFACAKKNLVEKGQGIPHLRPFNVGTNGELDFSEIYHVPKDFKDDIENYYLEPGDVLFNNTNSVELVGKTAIVRESVLGGFSNHITRLQMKDGVFVEPRWIALALRNLWMASYFAGRCNRWIGQAGFNTGMLAQVEVPIPYPDTPSQSLAVQRRVIARVEALLSEVNDAREMHWRLVKDTGRLMEAVLREAFPELDEGPDPSWTFIPLSSIGDVIGGGTPSKADPRYWGGAVPWVSPKDMKCIVIEDSQDHISQLGLEESSAKLIPTGAVLIVFRSGILAHSLPIAVSMRPLTVNQDLKAIVPREDLDPLYAAYALIARSQAILSRCVKKGATVHSLDSSRFWEELIPLPFPSDRDLSLRTQRGIVTYLDTVRAEIDAMQETQEQDKLLLEQLEQSILVQAFRGEL